MEKKEVQHVGTTLAFWDDGWLPSHTVEWCVFVCLRLGCHENIPRLCDTGRIFRELQMSEPLHMPCGNALTPGYADGVSSSLLWLPSSKQLLPLPWHCVIFIVPHYDRKLNFLLSYLFSDVCSFWKQASYCYCPNGQDDSVDIYEKEWISPGSFHPILGC